MHSRLILQWQIQFYQYYNSMLKQYQKSRQREAVAGAIKVRGYMLKKSKTLLSKYQRRFFMILDEYLAYFTDETLDELRKQFNLSDIKQIKIVSDVEFSFFYKIKEYILKTESTKERDQWVSSLNVITQYLESAKREVKSSSQPELTLSRKPSQETQFQTNIRTTFKLLHLSAMAQQFHQDYIKCRVAGHMCSKGCIFMVSCKSLITQIKDQIILDREYIEPYDFNVIYTFNVDTRTCSKLIACEDITEIVLTAKTLRINSSTINLIQDQTVFTPEFINRLKASIPIAAEYRNKDGITLKQNVDYLVQLYLKPEDRLQKQHLQMKLQDEYIGTIVQFGKDYKKNYQKFSNIIKYLTAQIQDTINAIKLKKSDVQQLCFIYVGFYYQKIYKLLKSFWSDNHQTIRLQELISMTSLSNNYYDAISKYVNEGSKFLNGVKLLRDIYLKKILADVQITLKDIMRIDDLFSLRSDNITNFSVKFINIVLEKAEIIRKYCDCQALMKEGQQLMLQAVIILMISQLDTRLALQNYQQSLLVAFCNDIWFYQDSMSQEFPSINLNEVNKFLQKFHRSLIKKLYIHFYSIKTVQFANLNLQYYTNTVLNSINRLQNVHPKSLVQIKERMAEDFNTFYFRNLVNACQQSIIFKNIVNQMIGKVQKDITLVKKNFPKQSQQKVISFFKCLILLMTEQQQQKIKQCYLELKSSLSPEDFRQNDIKSILQLKYSNQESDRKISFLGNVQPSETTLEPDSPEVQHTQSFGSIRPRKQTQQRTEAQLLINNDIDLEGYLQRKKIQVNYFQGKYNQQYFKLNSECLLWYNNPGTQDLLGRIFLSDIKETYLHSKKPFKFYIDLKNGTRHKFKSCSVDAAIKWVQQINCSSVQPKTIKTISFRNLQSQDIFVDFFELNSKKSNQNRPSMISNFRNHEPSRLIADGSISSESPIKSRKQKTGKKKFNLGKLFGCVSLQ